MLVRVSVGLHAGGAAALALAPRFWPLVVGTLIADHLTVVAAGLWPRGTLLGPTLVRLPPAARARRGFDTVTGDTGRVLARLVRGLAPGDILLLHDGSSARGASGGPIVLEVLPRLLDAVEAAGLKPVPLEPPKSGERVDRE